MLSLSSSWFEKHFKVCFYSISLYYILGLHCYTFPEANALIYKLGLRQRDYQNLRNGAIKKGFDLYPSYKTLWNYRKNNCLPNGIIYEREKVTAPMQGVLDHQMARRMNYDLLKKISEFVEQNYYIVAYYKYGADSASGNKYSYNIFLLNEMILSLSYQNFRL